MDPKLRNKMLWPLKWYRFPVLVTNFALQRYIVNFDFVTQVKMEERAMTPDSMYESDISCLYASGIQALFLGDFESALEIFQVIQACQTAFHSGTEVKSSIVQNQQCINCNLSTVAEVSFHIDEKQK